MYKHFKPQTTSNGEKLKKTKAGNHSIDNDSQGQ